MIFIRSQEDGMIYSKRLPTGDVDVLMTPTRVPPVLITGATGRVGRVVIDLLIDAGVPVRALTHRSEATAPLPANVEVVTGDLAVPESLDAGLRGVGTVFLVWTAPPETAPEVVERLATYARRVVFLSAPHQTPHPLLPATESDGGALRRYRAAHRGRRARVDDHPAGDLRVERVALVGDRDPHRGCRPVAVRRCRDGTRR